MKPFEPPPCLPHPCIGKERNVTLHRANQGRSDGRRRHDSLSSDERQAAALGALRREYLDHLLIHGERHLRRDLAD